MSQQFTRHVGEKFWEDGSAREFPGNTIICPVSPHSSTMKTLTHLRNSILGESWHSHFALLPPSSYHMTVFDLVCDQLRKPEHWTNALSLEASLLDVDTLLVDRWLKLPPPPLFAVRFQSLKIGEYITIRLMPENPNANALIRAYRDLLSETFEIHHPNHEDYFFHISLAYAITPITREEQKLVDTCNAQWSAVLGRELGSIDLLPPSLTFFADMTHFSTRRENGKRNILE